MDAELKSILTVLLDKVERIDATLPTLATKDDVARLETRVDRLEQSVDRLEQSVDRLDQSVDRLDQSMDRLEDRMDRLERNMDQFGEEQRQMKEMVGVLRMREIGRLDGRIDQLTLEVGLGRKPAAL